MKYGERKAVETHSYTTPDAWPISRSNEVKDLGVWMQDDASFEKQIHETILKSQRQVSWMLRTFKTRDAVLMMTLYKSLILPILEYCSQLWSPLAVGKIQNLEAVQRAFTNKISGLGNINYWERLVFCVFIPWSAVENATLLSIFSKF